MTIATLPHRRVRFSRLEHLGPDGWFDMGPAALAGPALGHAALLDAHGSACRPKVARPEPLRRASDGGTLREAGR